MTETPERPRVQGLIEAVSLATRFAELWESGNDVSIYEFDPGCCEEQQGDIHTTVFTDGSKFHIDPFDGAVWIEGTGPKAPLSGTTEKQLELDWSAYKAKVGL